MTKLYRVDKYINLRSFKFSCDAEKYLRVECPCISQVQMYTPRGSLIVKSNPLIKAYVYIS